MYLYYDIWMPANDLGMHQWQKNNVISYCHSYHSEWTVAFFAKPFTSAVIHLDHVFV